MDKIAYHLPTLEAYKQKVQEWLDEGKIWVGGSKDICSDRWKYYRENTCMTMGKRNDGFYIMHKKECVEEDYTIIEYKFKKSRYEIGQSVEIVNTGDVYTTYKKLFEKLGFKDCEDNDFYPDDQGKTFTIFNKAPHIETGVPLIAITDGVRELLIGEKGVVPAKKAFKKGSCAVVDVIKEIVNNTEYDYRDSCGANNCECYENSVTIDAIIQYLESQRTFKEESEEEAYEHDKFGNLVTKEEAERNNKAAGYCTICNELVHSLDGKAVSIDRVKHKTCKEEEDEFFCTKCQRNMMFCLCENQKSTLGKKLKEPGEIVKKLHEILCAINEGNNK